MTDTILCYYFDEYDSTSNKSGITFIATKHLVPKIKYYNKIDQDNLLYCYYIVEGDCYTLLNLAKLQFKSSGIKLNSTGCYDLIDVNTTTLDTFLSSNNINYKKLHLTESLLNEISEPLSDSEFELLVNELHINNL